MTDETTVVPLQRSLFTADPSHPQALLSHGELTAAAARYPSGVETLVMTSSRVRLEILPFMGQIIWDAVVDGVSLRMDNMFRQPLPAKEITQTYGCFAFHSGLLAYLNNDLMHQLVAAMWLVHQNVTPQLAAASRQEMEDAADAHAAILRACEAGEVGAYVEAVNAHYAPLLAIIEGR